MVRDDAVTLIGQRLGNRTDLATRAITEMQLVQSDTLERHHWLPWFLETEYNTATLTAGESRVPLPADVLQEIEDEDLYLLPASSSEYIRLTRQASDRFGPTFTTPSVPEAFTVSGEQLVFLPGVPDQNYTVKWKYYGADTVLTGNVQNKWLKYAPNLVIAATCSALCEHIERRDLQPIFAAKVAEAWDTLYRQHVSREEANRPRVMEAL